MTRLLLFAILLIVVARLFWRLVDAVIAGAARGESAAGSARRAPVKLVRDPVCGTFVPPRAALSVTAGGSTHYFCSEECRRKFDSRQ
ncbi:MAG: YHS domain-containing protein [Acidobacteria bacterium]|nr:YHS domain-containing protein [Acidobacteriota bacterium]